MAKNWQIKGELVLNCNCSVFCPCVISLGQHDPTEGYCHGWACIRIDKGHHAKTVLTGLNIGLLLDIPGKMGRGNWTVALYIDQRADDAQADAITQIITGAAGGTTGLLRLLVGQFLGTSREAIEYESDGDRRIIRIGKKIDAVLAPVKGAEADAPVTITNSSYWISPDIVVAEAKRAKIMDHGRVWNFEGRSAEFCGINWSG
ncbi:MAG: DUF1326 domain-containing protein [Pseudomonadota bacterium]